MQDLINEFVLQLHKKKNISPNTEESYIRDVRKLFEYFEKENKKVQINTILKEDLEEYFTKYRKSANNNFQNNCIH